LKERFTEVLVDLQIAVVVFGSVFNDLVTALFEAPAWIALFAARG